MRACRTVARTTNLPGRFWRRSAGGNHQSPRHTDTGADQRDESQLYGIQIPSDQESSMAKGTR